MPFSVAAADGVLRLTLDTPGSPVNVFNRATAEQLTAILADVTPATTRAIVFETAKPASFINGVGLLLAQAAQTYEDCVRASEPAWAAYRAVHDAPVPTIAVVQGSCFGCGVEFALNCDYRIASDSGETSFYMTELNDYLFVPLFGSTWNLPEAVGLERAIDLLLWGERWDARAAWAGGLADVVAPHATLAERARLFVDDVLAGGRPSRRRGRVEWGDAEDAAVDRARRRIAGLPPAYHAVYADALRLLVDGARQTRDYAGHRADELRCSAASALAPIGKGAYAFFYLRQMAAERAGGRTGTDAATLRLGVDEDAAEDARAFAETARTRNVPGIVVTDAREADVRLVGGPNGHRPSPRDVVVRLRLADAPVGGVELYAPTLAHGGRLIELATRPGDAAPPRLGRALQRLGFEVACTAASGAFVTNRLLAAYLAPLVRAVDAVDDDDGAARVNGALRAAGFVRRPHAFLAALDLPALARLLAPVLGEPEPAIARRLAVLAGDDRVGDAGESPVLDALCMAFLDAVLTARADGAVRHLPIVDLIAREVLDFPRHLVSLCGWLKTARVASALDDEAACRLVAPDAVAAARAFVATGRELYR